jgi:transcription elongation GreA/GreB family factor
MMDLQVIKDWIAHGDIAAVESAWLEALAEKAPPADMVSVVEALVAKGQRDSAGTLASMLLEERKDLPPRELLEVAKLLVSAAPDSADLRARLAELYRQVFAASCECVAGLLAASGLQSGQSPRRALRTLDLCLGLQPDVFLVSRYESRVVQAKRFDEVMGQFEIVDEAGRKQLIEPKLLADEYEPIDPRDFRVMARYRPEEVKPMVADNPGGVLIGLCLSRGGRINANDIKEFLVGRFLTSEEWGDWWGRARTAAKRSPQLTLEGRSPITVVYHPGGRTLEEELEPALKSARTPMDWYGLLQQYLREARTRKVPVDAGFAGRLVEALAEQAKLYLARRPLDALTASLAVQVGLRAGATAPAAPASPGGAAASAKETCPSPADILAGAEEPAELLSEVEDESLWEAGLEALSATPAAEAHLRGLLYRVPAWRLDEVVSRLPGGPADEGVVQAASDALSDPLKNLELFLWLWQRPQRPPANVPPRVELLSRLLKALGDLGRMWNLEGPRRKGMWQRVRSALSAADYAPFKAAADEMDEHVAATIKRQVERMEGLAQSVRENMLQVLRERHPNLFYTREKVNPWEEEGTLWTTEAALHRREVEYKDLTDIKIPANARAIGAAAAHGDLSENSEWKFALEERDMLAARAMKMQEEISQARVIHPQDVPTETVGVGSRVRLTRLPDGEEFSLAFLGPWDGDPEKGIYSYQTNMAQELMGKGVGDEAVLKIGGEENTYRIERITSALG